MTVLRWRLAKAVLGRAAGKYRETTWQVTVKPLVHTAGFYTDFSSPLNVFASMPLARLEPVRQRYVTRYEANCFVHAPQAKRSQGPKAKCWKQSLYSIYTDVKAFSSLCWACCSLKFEKLGLTLTFYLQYSFIHFLL